MKYKAKILTVSEEYGAISMTQGIPKEKQARYDHSPFFHGSNGSYGYNENPPHLLNIRIRIYDYYGENDNLTIKQDIMDYCKTRWDYQRSSQKLIGIVKTTFEGKVLYINDDLIYKDEDGYPIIAEQVLDTIS